MSRAVTSYVNQGGSAEIENVIDILSRDEQSGGMCVERANGGRIQTERA